LLGKKIAGTEDIVYQEDEQKVKSPRMENFWNMRNELLKKHKRFKEEKEPFND
jgi:hypothetical protein